MEDVSDIEKIIIYKNEEIDNIRKNIACNERFTSKMQRVYGTIKFNAWALTQIDKNGNQIIDY